MKNKELIREQLIALAKAEKLTPSEVVRLAEPPSSPLHDCFTWNDEEAAHKYRLDQARELISTFELTVTINRIELQVNQFVRDPSKDSQDQGYVAIVSIEPESEMAREFVLKELTVARTYVERTRRYSAMLGVDKDIGHLSDRLDQVASSLHKKRK
jgi:hypothetical protein